MADLGIRTLERRFQASRSPEDELAWLRERVRLGQRLEWAAYTRLAELSAQGAAAYLTRLVYPGFEVKLPRYGVRDGVPFDEARLRNKPS